jgi:hypothetical protein
VAPTLRSQRYRAFVGVLERHKIRCNALVGHWRTLHGVRTGPSDVSDLEQIALTLGVRPLLKFGKLKFIAHFLLDELQGKDLLLIRSNTLE